MISLVEKMQFHRNHSFPFVVYCKPNSDEIIGLFQKNDDLHEVKDFTEEGFVFASFDGKENYLIPNSQSESIHFPLDEANVEFKTNEHNSSDTFGQATFENLVSKGIQAIEDGNFHKVVLSRKESVALANFDIVTAFQKMVSLYDTAFVYCFYHPKIGTWLGATPERLLKADSKKFETMALAGTQENRKETKINWQKKEQDEQQFVTDYIVSNLKKYASNIQISVPHSIKAGNVWHIQTHISGVFNSEFDLKNVVQLLHPTPAVCGVPKQEALEFILANEEYDRKFYTGFLGELNKDTVTDLFVNLRCMQIESTQAYLYMGCGITKESISAKEWVESVNKSKTMRQIL